MWVKSISYLFFSAVICSLLDSDLVSLFIEVDFGSVSFVVVAADMVH